MSGVGQRARYALTGVACISGSTEGGDEPNLVPIVLGGPWADNGERDDGEYWEVWRNGARLGSSDAPYRIHNGEWQFQDNGNWESCVTQYGKAEIHAPRDWVPTPDTIPEGCMIATPNGYFRDCSTCARSGINDCYDRTPGGHARIACRRETDLHRWVPKAKKDRTIPGSET